MVWVYIVHHYICSINLSLYTFIPFTEDIRLGVRQNEEDAKHHQRSETK